jgi:signal peptidase I
MGYGDQRTVQRFLETLPNDRPVLINSYGDDSPTENTGVYVVPPHCYFVLGDNRDDSLDSRFRPGEYSAGGDASCPWTAALGALDAVTGVGFVPEADLEGRARLILFSSQPGRRRDRVMVDLH